MSSEVFSAKIGYTGIYSRTWISNYIPIIPCLVILHTCPNCNNALSKQSLKLCNAIISVCVRNYEMVQSTLQIDTESPFNWYCFVLPYGWVLDIKISCHCPKEDGKWGCCNTFFSPNLILALNRVISLRRQDISSHDIDYIEYVDPSLTWGRILNTCVISTWRKYIKCKYMFMIPLKNLARQGLNSNALKTLPCIASIALSNRLEI